MIWPIIISFLFGVTGVLQGSVNKEVSLNWGVPKAVIFNSWINLFFAYAIFFLAYKFKDSIPQMFYNRGTWADFKWWFILPGLFGFFIVVLIPWTIAKIGALRVMLLVIIAQIITSTLWDLWVEKIPLTTPRVLGSIITLIGVAITTLQK